MTRGLHLGAPACLSPEPSCLPSPPAAEQPLKQSLLRPSGVWVLLLVRVCPCTEGLGQAAAGFPTSGVDGGWRTGL